MVHARDVERDRADIVVGRPEPHTRPLAHARPVGEPKNGRVAMAHTGANSMPQTLAMLVLKAPSKLASYTAWKLANDAVLTDSSMAIRLKPGLGVSSPMPR